MMKLVPSLRTSTTILGRAQNLLRHVPLFLFISAIATASFAYGGLVVRYALFPYSIVASGVKTFREWRSVVADADVGRFVGFVAARPKNGGEDRIQSLNDGSLGGPVLWYGGRFQFLDYCPDWGCIAVEYTADGELAHAYPYRPDELERAWNAGASDDFPYEFSPGFSFTRDVYPTSMNRYPDGDLLAGFNNRHAFPFMGGVARIDRDGHPVWFRREYFHQWAQIEDDGDAMLPSTLLSSDSISFDLADHVFNLDCGSKSYRPTISFIDKNGHLFKRLNVTNALLDSPFAPILQYSTSPQRNREDPCDIIHLNFVHRLRDDAGGTWGMAPGDIVASLRNLSAFAILDGESGRVKRLVRGSFFHQHSVQHLQGSRFLLFDNIGSDGVHGPSRVLIIDLANGQETTLFPNDSTPEHLQDLFSIHESHIDVSPDRSRAIVAFSREGVAVEIRLSDGEALNVFKSLHDVSDLHQFPTERETKAAMFRIYGIEYIPDQKGAAR